MANAKIVTYGCELCGSKVIVTSTGESRLSPIYCCGMEVTKLASFKKKPAAAKKKPAAAKKKKPFAKKKSSKK